MDASASAWNETAYRNWRKRVYRPAAEAAGQPTLRPYDLRHSFASLRIYERAPAIEIAQEMGNSGTNIDWDGAICPDGYTIPTGSDETCTGRFARRLGRLSSQGRAGSHEIHRPRRTGAAEPVLDWAAVNAARSNPKEVIAVMITDELYERLAQHIDDQLDLHRAELRTVADDTTKPAARSAHTYEDRDSE